MLPQWVSHWMPFQRHAASYFNPRVHNQKGQHSSCGKLQVNPWQFLPYKCQGGRNSTVPGGLPRGGGSYPREEKPGSGRLF